MRSCALSLGLLLCVPILSVRACDHRSDRSMTVSKESLKKGLKVQLDYSESGYLAFELFQEINESTNVMQYPLTDLWCLDLQPKKITISGTE